VRCRITAKKANFEGEALWLTPLTELFIQTQPTPVFRWE